ncbi:MAG: multidrug effflux MFS transporter [Chthoniobacteraceae bacterium]|nr:multidrug effflux MFS transporter [Chthoniobacteraceae bacterium]
MQPAPVPLRHPHLLTVLLGVLTAFGPMSIDMYLPSFGQITHDFAARPGTVQFTLAIYLLGVGVSQAFYGPLADRLGRRRPMLAGCALYAAGSLACAFAPSMALFFTGRIMQALGGAAGMVISRAVVRDLYDERQAAGIFSQLMTVMGVAPILAPWVGGQILVYGTWRLIFFVLTGFGCFCFLATAFGLPETLPPQRRRNENLTGIVRVFHGLLRHRGFRGYALVAGFVSGTNFAYIAGSSYVYMELYGVSAQHFGYFFGANACGLALAGQANRWLLRRSTPEAILDRALTANVVLGLALAFCGATGLGRLPAIAVLLFCALFNSGLAFPNLTAAVMAPFQRSAGSASALLGTVQFAVGGLAGATVGLLTNGTALPMTGTLAVCATAGFLVLRALHQNRPAAE